MVKSLSKNITLRHHIQEIRESSIWLEILVWEGLSFVGWLPKSQIICDEEDHGFTTIPYWLLLDKIRSWDIIRMIKDHDNYRLHKIDVENRSIHLRKGSHTLIISSDNAIAIIHDDYDTTLAAGLQIGSLKDWELIKSLLILKL